MRHFNVDLLKTSYDFGQRLALGRWGEADEVACVALFLASDLDARNGKKRSTFWTGYKAHFTRTCDDDAPQLITQVQTTPAPRSDEGVLSAIHADLAEKELLPGQHLVDSGYATLANLVTSRSDHEVDLVGPTKNISELHEPASVWRGKRVETELDNIACQLFTVLITHNDFPFQSFGIMRANTLASIKFSDLLPVLKHIKSLANIPQDIGVLLDFELEVGRRTVDFYLELLVNGWATSSFSRRESVLDFRV